MVNLKKCRKCYLPNGARGMLENGQYISDVAYYFGRGSLQAVAVRVWLDDKGVCNICRMKERPKDIEPMTLK